MVMLVVCLMLAAYASVCAQSFGQEDKGYSSNGGHKAWPLRERQTRNTQWPLGSVESRSDLNRLFCSRNVTAPGPFCRVEGLAAFLLAARFNFSRSESSEKAAWSTATNVPWILADYIITKTVTQEAVSVSKTLYGEAQVDAFLCNDAECTVMADIRTIIARDSSEADYWCRGAPASCMLHADSGTARNVFSFTDGQKRVISTPRRALHVRMLGLGKAANKQTNKNSATIPTAVIKDTSMASFTRVVGNDNSPDQTARYEVVWEEGRGN